ncbi:hypothetical protein [Phytohabitans houttuyneae]|uniref:Uncharacterized protein n=1 Tax=Phytohabitans houttuyneae TaxID=1076126 RepID=A0A6V8KJQ4_9ACTN|nr:hypothetical protein [Phytohabitans houttuyneae]GFJ80905.1 hypothetical protein Phou_050850 [Phytohabitans houttuyneae]
MSSHLDPTLRGGVYPSEEEIDPASSDVEPASDAIGRGPAPTLAPRPQVDTAGRSIVSRHQDGSVEVVTDFDGDGIADVVQLDLDGDGVPDITYIDSDRDGRLDTVLRTPGH